MFDLINDIIYFLLIFFSLTLILSLKSLMCGDVYNPVLILLLFVILEIPCAVVPFPFVPPI